MLSTSDLMAAAKGAKGITSNYRLARVLDTSDNTLYRWKKGESVPDDSHAVKLAHMAGLDPGYVVAAMRALREKDPELRAVWEDMANKLSALATMRRMSIGGPKGGGSDGIGGDLSDESGSGGGGLLSKSDDEGPLCVMSTRRRREKALRASLGKAIKKARAH